MEPLERILFDTLAHGRRVTLPGVGTLAVERVVASFVSGRSLRPPYYKVVFVPQEDAAGRSLGEEPGYAAWLKGTEREQGVRDFGPAGILRDGTFEMTPALAERLNPQGTDPVPLHPASRAGRVVAVVAGVLVVAVAVIWWGSRSGDVDVREVRAPQTVAAEARPVDDGAATAVRVAEQEAATPADTLSAASPAAVLPEAEPAAGPLFHVVVGVFSEEVNADKLIAADPLGIGTAGYRKVPFRNSQLLVSAFASTDRAAADSCRRVLSRRNGELWVYEQR